MSVNRPGGLPSFSSNNRSNSVSFSGKEASPKSPLDGLKPRIAAQKRQAELSRRDSFDLQEQLKATTNPQEAEDILEIGSDRLHRYGNNEEPALQLLRDFRDISNGGVRAEKRKPWKAAFAHTKDRVQNGDLKGINKEALKEWKDPDFEDGVAQFVATDDPQEFKKGWRELQAVKKLFYPFWLDNRKDLLDAASKHGEERVKNNKIPGVDVATLERIKQEVEEK